MSMPERACRRLAWRLLAAMFVPLLTATSLAGETLIVPDQFWRIQDAIEAA